MDILTKTAQEYNFKNYLGIDLPTSSVADEIYERTRANGRKSLFFFTTAILNWDLVQQVPHLEICNFIQKIPKQRKVVLIPRDCYKSTIISKSFPLWILLQEDFCGLPGPEHRILLASFSAVNASKQLWSIRKQVEGNPNLQWLYPELIPDFSRTVWTDNSLLFPRQGAYGENSIEAAGVDTHLVSRHYTVQLKDDLEDEKASESPAVRNRVKNWYKAAEALFVDERKAYDCLIGTRWGIDDLYNDIQVNESDTYEFLVRPLQWTQKDLVEDAEEATRSKKPKVYVDMSPESHAPDSDKTYYFFPTLFPAESIKRIRAKQGSFMFSMLFMNNPKDPALAEFKASDLRDFVYSTEGDIIPISDTGEPEDVVPFDSLKRVLFWDPAPGAKHITATTSNNAMVVVYKDNKERLYIAEAWAEKKSPQLLYSRYISFQKRHATHKQGIEGVGFQRFLKFPLYAEMRAKNVRPFPIINTSPVADKDSRIRALIPYVESNLVYVRKGLVDIREEMKGFPMFPTKDLVDAAAACLELLGTSSVRTETEIRRDQKIVASGLKTRDSLTGY